MTNREVPEGMLEWVDEAYALIMKQKEDPHVYDENTQEALDRVSAYAAIFKMESATASLNGDRTIATFYNKNCEALEYMINSLKYKIKKVTNF